MAKEKQGQAKKPRENAAKNKSSAAGKRSEQQPKAAGKGASSKPTTAERKRGAIKRTTSSTTIGEKQNCPKVDAKVKKIAEQVEQTDTTQKRQGIFKRLIETLKRVIGYKKGERDEVRYNNKEGHKNWVFKKEGEKYIAFGITHNEETFGRKNMPLKHNPDPNDPDDAYIRNGIIKQKDGMSKNPKKNVAISAEDKPNVKSKRRYHEKESKRQAAKKRAKQKQKSK